MPILAAVTLISNTVIIIVLSRSNMIIKGHLGNIDHNDHNNYDHDNRHDRQDHESYIRPGMVSPTNTVLLAMAICDLLTIIIPTPWYEDREDNIIVLKGFIL